MKRIGLIGFAVAILLAWGYWAGWVEPAVKQPIEFPHKNHLKQIRCEQQENDEDDIQEPS